MQKEYLSLKIKCKDNLNLFQKMDFLLANGKQIIVNCMKYLPTSKHDME